MFNDKNKFQRSNRKPIENIQESKYESGSTIRSNEEQKSISINVPNYSVYSTGQNNEVEKVLIDKTELIAFAQCFAQEKITLENTVQKLREENYLISRQIQQLRKQNQSIKSLNQSIRSHNTTQYYEAVETLKSKLKQEFEKRLQAERQMHTIEGVVFELRKKNEFLVDKMKHHEDQVQRCENLLKIKEDIIQNFEWQKANNTIKHEKKQNKTQQPHGTDSKRNQINETLDLSQINFSEQKKSININSSSHPHNTVIVERKQPKYVINKKPRDQDSRKKLNISIHKKSSCESKEEKNQSNEKPNKEKSKPKGIVLKKHMNNSSLIEDSSQHKHKQQQYIKIISNLQKQNETLRNELIESSITEKIENNALKPSNQNIQLSQTNTYQLIQKKYNMMKQKCLLLEGQIQKTIRNYILAQQRNSQLEQIIQSSLNNSAAKSSEAKATMELQNHSNRPGLSLQDLVTPQFRESKFSNNFFAKKNNQNHWNHSQFNQIQIEDYQMRTNSHLFDTFQKNKHTNQQLGGIRERNERSFQKSEFSRHLNGIEDVSEIVCRNEQSMAMGDTLDL